MKISVLLANNFDESEYKEFFNNSVCMVIDVLRATSTMAAIFGSRARRIITSQSKDLAFKLKKWNSDFILCGEEGGLIIDGFDYDNSPSTISKTDLTGKTVIMKTTNGTHSFKKAKFAKAAFPVALLNLSYTVDCVLDCACKNKNDIVILCSGKQGKIAYDDAFTAGVVVKKIMEKVKDIELDDAGELVYNSALKEKSIMNVFLKSSSGKSCAALNLREDLKYCSLVDKYNIAGKMQVLDLNDRFRSIICLEPYKM